MLKLKARGRGKHVSAMRGVAETLQEVMFAGAWPARLWDRVPSATRVREVRHALALGRAGRAPLKLAFASDLHIGPLTPPRLPEKQMMLG